MKTTATMAITFALLIGLTACSSKPCDKYTSHNGQKDYCINNEASKASLTYLDNGATPSGNHNSGIFSGLTLKKSLETVNTIRKAVL